MDGMCELLSFTKQVILTPHCAVFSITPFTPYHGVPRKTVQPEEVRVLGANIRRERIVRGLTQERLAELADLNPRTVQKIEAGTITILVTTLIRIRHALDSDWTRLLG